MFKIHLLFDEVFLTLDSTNPNKSAPLQIEGDPAIVSRVKALLDNAYGAFGHIFNIEYTTPIDLYYAARTYLDSEFSPVVVEGKELVEDFDPGIPEDSVT